MKKNKLLFFFNLLLIYTSALCQQSIVLNIDSLESQYSRLPDDTIKVNLLIDLANNIQFYDPARSLLPVKEAIEISYRLGWQKGLSGAMNCYGVSCAVMGNFDTSLYYFRKSFEIEESLGNKKATAIALGNIANVYSNKGDFVNALTYNFKSLQINEEIGNKSGMARDLGNIGIIYTNQKSYAQALEYFQKALAITKKLGERNNSSLHLTNIGVIYFETGRLDEALAMSQEALAIDTELNNNYGIGHHLINIANIYLKEKKYGESLSYFLKALALNEKFGNKENIARNLFNLSQLYFTLTEDSVSSQITEHSRQFSTSKIVNHHLVTDYAEKAMVLAKETGDKKLISDIHEILYKSYKECGNFEKAFYNLKDWQVSKDSIFNVENSNTLLQLEAKREVEIKEKEIAYQHKLILLFIAITIIVLLFLVVTFTFYINKKKTAEALAEKNRIISDLNFSKDRFISILAHDLKNPFNTILGFIALLSRNVRNYDIEKTEKQIRLIQKAAENVFSLLEDLLLWANAQGGNIPFEPAETDLGRICNDVVSGLNHTIQSKNISLDFSEIMQTKVFADENMLKFILRNLISNAVKFTNPGGKIRISAQELESAYTISVIDNGIGMDEILVKEIFEISRNRSRTGTEGEHGSGLGLIICREFVEKHGGHIQVNSEKGKGSVFSFTLPHYGSSI